MYLYWILKYSEILTDWIVALSCFGFFISFSILGTKFYRIFKPVEKPKYTYDHRKQLFVKGGKNEKN